MQDWCVLLVFKITSESTSSLFSKCTNWIHNITESFNMKNIIKEGNNVFLFQGWHQTWGKRSRSLRTTLRCPTRRGTRMGTTSSPWISDFHVIVLLPFYTKFLVLKVCFKSQTLSVPFLCLKFFLTCFSLLQLVSWHSFWTLIPVHPKRSLSWYIIIYGFDGQVYFYTEEMH